jgi:hypothetical protein
MANLSAIVDLHPIKDRIPNKDFATFFKVGSRGHLLAMQKGLLYMNSLSYFSGYEEDSRIPVRRDELEDVYIQASGGKARLIFEVEDDRGGKQFELGKDASLRIHMPYSENTFLFCMGVIAEESIDFPPGESHGAFRFDERYRNFGDHVLLITNPPEFLRRIQEEISSASHVYGTQFLEGGHGRVDYIDAGVHVGLLGLFRKGREYAWQNEYRIAMHVKKEALNPKGAFEFNIGDISDISAILSLERLIERPLSVKKRVIKKSDLDSLLKR